MRTIVVTGAGSGIGRATALKFAANGDHVVAIDRDFSDGDGSQLPETIQKVVCDVQRVDLLQQIIADAVRERGELHALINNAGTGLVKAVPDVEEAEWDNVLNVNLKAPFFASRAAILQMSQQKSGGCIVNVASNAGLLPRSHDPVYSISKMALVSMTRSLALCHSVDRIRINCVCPGPVERTQMIEENFPDGCDRQQVTRQLISASPLARAWDRMVRPEEVADSIFYLCSEAAHMITGTAIAIDGGKSLGVPPQ